MSYTLGSTASLGIVLVALTGVVYYFFKKLKIKLDSKILIGLFFWVLLAAFVRVFEDANIYPKNFFTVSPGIIILFAGFFIPVLYFGGLLEKNRKIEMWKTLSVSAIVPIIFHLPFVRLANMPGFLVVMSIFGAIVGVMYLTNRFIKTDNFSFLAIAAHMFDASATFTSIQFYGYSEQHVIPTFLIGIFGPWAMFLLKIVIILPVVFAINKYSENENLRKFLLIATFAIGLAPALRDTFRLLMGV